MKDGVVLSLFAIALIAGAVTHESQAEEKTGLYKACYRPVANAALVCEPEKRGP